MNQHKYLRAYMAGIVVPTIVLCDRCNGVLHRALRVRFSRTARTPHDFSDGGSSQPVGSLEHVLFVASPRGNHLSIGLHGALLPFLLGAARHPSHRIS